MSASVSTEPGVPTPLDRDRIVATAGDLVDRVGPEELTLTRIAAELGVTQPALYRHVAGLSDLWRLLGVSTRTMLADALAEASVGHSGASSLRAVAIAWRQFGTDHPGRYRCTDRHAVAGDESLEVAAARTVDVLQRSLRGFGLSPADTIAAAYTVRSALHGFVAYELGDGHPSGVADAAFEHLIDHLCRAFTSSAAARTDRPGT